MERHISQSSETISPPIRLCLFCRALGAATKARPLLFAQRKLYPPFGGGFLYKPGSDSLLRDSSALRPNPPQILQRQQVYPQAIQGLAAAIVMICQQLQQNIPLFLQFLLQPLKVPPGPLQIFQPVPMGDEGIIRPPPSRIWDKDRPRRHNNRLPGHGPGYIGQWRRVGCPGRLRSQDNSPPAPWDKGSRPIRIRIARGLVDGNPSFRGS